MTDWQSKVVLNTGETLRHDGSSSKGFMQETDVDSYSIVQADGVITGSVTVTDHTAVKGFKRTVHIVQKNASGKIIIDEIL